MHDIDVNRHATATTYKTIHKRGLEGYIDSFSAKTNI